MQQAQRMPRSPGQRALTKLKLIGIRTSPIETEALMTWLRRQYAHVHDLSEVESHGFL